MFLAASLYPLFHPCADSILLSFPLSLSLSLSLSPLPLSLVLSGFFIILSSSFYAHIIRSISSREITLSLILVFVSLYTRAASHTHISTLLLIPLSYPFASGARASIQRRVPRLPLLCTCH